MSGGRNKHNTRHAQTGAEREAQRTLEFSREETRWVSGNRWSLCWAQEVSWLWFGGDGEWTAGQGHHGSPDMQAAGPGARVREQREMGGSTGPHMSAQPTRRSHGCHSLTWLRGQGPGKLRQLSWLWGFMPYPSPPLPWPPHPGPGPILVTRAAAVKPGPSRRTRVHPSQGSV